MMCLIQLKSPQGASNIFLKLYLLINFIISALIFTVLSSSEPGPETLSLDGQKFEE